MSLELDYTAADNGRWFLQAMNLEEREQVPVSLGVGGDILLAQGPYDPRQYYRQIEQRVEAQVKLNERWNDLAGYLVEIGTPNCAQFGAAFGAKLVWNETADCFSQAFLKPDDIPSLQVPDPYEAPVVCKWPECTAYMIAKGRTPGGVWSEGPVDTACQLVGATTFCTLVYEDPGLAHELMRKTTAFVIACLRMQIDAIGKEVPVTIGDDMCGYLSPKLFSEFALPYLTDVFEAFPLGPDRPFRIFHSDTNQMHNLHLIVELPVNAFNCGPHDMMPLAEVKRVLAGKLAIIGNIKPTYFGSLKPEEMDALCRQQIEEGAPGGGYVLAPGGEMFKGATDENIAVMLGAVQKYGRRVSV